MKIFSGRYPDFNNLLCVNPCVLQVDLLNDKRYCHSFVSARASLLCLAARERGMNINMAGTCMYAIFVIDDFRHIGATLKTNAGKLASLPFYLRATRLSCFYGNTALPSMPSCRKISRPGSRAARRSFHAHARTRPTDNLSKMMISIEKQLISVRQNETNRCLTTTLFFLAGLPGPFASHDTRGLRT